MTVTNLALRFVGIIVALTFSLTAPAHAQSCATDSDCGAPLTCKSPGGVCTQGATRLPDGGFYVTPPVCEAMPSQCTLVFSACQADSDCSLTNWGCFLFPLQSTVKVCFPAYKPCSATQACPAAWSCITSAAPSSHDPGAFWGTAGASNYCWPDSLAGFLDGTIRSDASGLNLSFECGGTGAGGKNGSQACAGGSRGIGLSGAGGSSGATDPGPNLSNGGHPYVADSGAAATQPALTSSKSGCAIAGPAGQSTWFALMAFAVVALISLGRRAQRR